MKRSLLLISAVCMSVLFGFSTKDSNPVLNVEGGQVQGVKTATEGVTVYRGIPYAAAPVGDLRWKEPQPVTPWQGVKVADTFSAASVQEKHTSSNPYTSEFFYEGDPEFSEDCLYLNVWTPAAGKADAKLPVAMWIHGGGFTGGWSFEREMDGEAWAQRGVILVTINYRLGIFGFLTHPLLSDESPYGRSGNYGQLDQIAALKWVKDNIAEFGGDPDNITIFGQSAGARSVKNLVTSELTGDIIRKAVIMSAGGVADNPQPQVPDIAGIEASAKTIFDWGGYDTLEKMRQASTEEIFSLASRYAKENGNAVRLTLQPYVDGHFLKTDFDMAATGGKIKDIPYMMGSVMNDLGALGNGIDRFAELRDIAGKPAYIYQFARPLPDNEMGTHAMKGAFHSSELWYIFHTIANSDRPFVEADYKLSDDMVDAWTNFVKYADPNAPGQKTWTPYTSSNPKTMVFKLNDDCTATASAMGDPIR